MVCRVSASLHGRHVTSPSALRPVGPTAGDEPTEDSARRRTREWRRTTGAIGANNSARPAEGDSTTGTHTSAACRRTGVRSREGNRRGWGSRRNNEKQHERSQSEHCSTVPSSHDHCLASKVNRAQTSLGRERQNQRVA